MASLLSRQWAADNHGKVRKVDEQTGAGNFFNPKKDISAASDTVWGM